MEEKNINPEDYEISQEEVDTLLSQFITVHEAKKSLLDEINDAILDSGKLSLEEWRNLRTRIKEIEQLIPHIDMIIQLKSQSNK